MANFKFDASAPKNTSFLRVLAIAPIAAGLFLAVPAKATDPGPPQTQLPLLGEAEIPSFKKSDSTVKKADNVARRSLRQSKIPLTDKSDEGWLDPCVGPPPHQSIPTS